MTRPAASSRRLAGGALAGALVAAPMTAVGADAKFSDHVVQITCALDGGEARATGFVWPDPDKVVTALHAVAGCRRITVWSETTGLRSAARIDRVDLEADLALIVLDAEVGSPPARVAETPPAAQGDFIIWGYPRAAEEMIELDVDFAFGIKGGVTELGTAFGHRDLDRLFRDQDYPTPETKILRVTSTIQPGHSGAPIFDSEGAVVAMADGGLFDGVAPINWSIPAYVYLPGLLSSDDTVPTRPSEQAILHNSFEEVESASIVLGAESPRTPADAVEASDAEGGLAFVHRVSLRAAAEASGDVGEGAFSSVVEELVEDPAAFEALTFDLYAHDGSGAVYAFPTGMVPARDDETGVVFAGNANGTVAMAGAVRVTDSFATAVAECFDGFVPGATEGVVEWRDGDAPTESVLAEMAFDETAEQATFFGTFTGDDLATGAPTDVILSLEVYGSFYKCTAIYALQDGMGAQDLIDAAMMQFGATHLTGDIETAVQSGFMGEGGLLDRMAGKRPLTLNLVNRVGLADLIAAEVFYDEAGAALVEEFQSLLSDPAEIEDYAFDIYEESTVGAIIAVPTGIELVWHDRLQVLDAANPEGTAFMSVDLRRMASFDEAAGLAAANFTARFDALADWEGDAGPASFAYDVYDPDEQYASYFGVFDGSGTFEGLDGSTPATAFTVSMPLGLWVSGPVFIGASTQWAWNEGATDKDWKDFLLMRLAVEYLTDFAAY